jgi:hypothetical protein
MKAGSAPPAGGHPDRRRLRQFGDLAFLDSMQNLLTTQRQMANVVIISYPEKGVKTPSMGRSCWIDWTHENRVSE